MSQSTTSAAIPKRTSAKREEKRQLLTRLAAQAMNRDGAAAVMPASLAETTGFSRNALYHYFPDKETLLFSCYKDAAEHTLHTVELAIASSNDASERLTALVKGLLDAPDHLAILHDLELLPTESADTLKAIQTSTLVRVQDAVEEGIVAGTFRQAPASIAAHVLLGIADWARLWAAWTGVSVDELGRGIHSDTSVSTSIAHCLLHGFRQNSPPPAAPPAVDYLLGSRVDVLDRESIGVEKRLLLLGIASRLFNRRGIGATSIDDIARAAGATKGLIYHHFDGKDDLVDACYDRAFDLYERFAEIAETKAGVGAIESLTWSLHLNVQAQLSRSPPLILQSGASRLPIRHRRRAVAVAERFRHNMRCAIDNGLADSRAMPIVDFSAGAFFWIPRWHGEAAAVAPSHLGDQIVDLLGDGLLAK